MEDVVRLATLMLLAIVGLKLLVYIENKKK